MSKSKILLKVCGSIAAYKACYLTSRLNQLGYEVKVVMSKSAKEFIGTTSFEGLSGNPVQSDIFETGNAMEHIHLMRWADLIIACPATASFINRAANGMADDLLTTLFLAHDFKKPYLIAPAMNTSMYLHPTTQESLKKLKSYGVGILETASGVLACGENGWGKLLDPDLILTDIESALKKNPSPVPVVMATPKKYKVLVTSGGTTEPIDQVRSITNFSTGQTGAQLVATMNSLGFEVTHLAAKNSTKADTAAQQFEFTTFADFSEKLRTLLAESSFDAVIHLAALSDYQVTNIENQSGQNLNSAKISTDTPIKITLTPTKKLLPLIKEWSGEKTPLVIGFKLTSEAPNEEALASVKKVFERGSVDFVVHNDLSQISMDKHSFKIFDPNLKKIFLGDSKQQLIQAIIQTLLLGVKNDTHT